MTRAYLRRKSYAFGYGSAIAGGPTHNHLDNLVPNVARMAFAAMRGNLERAVYHELACANYSGYWPLRPARRLLTARLPAAPPPSATGGGPPPGHPPPTPPPHPRALLVYP